MGKISNKKLGEILLLVDRVSTGEIVKELIEEIPNCKIIKKSWGDDWKNGNSVASLYPLDLTKPSIWSTYDGCK